jgi:hypothetical protein
MGARLAHVADVYVLSRDAGLPLPDSGGPFELVKRLFARSG